MAVLEQITNMRNQGVPDNQIINNLRQQGVSPDEINTALGQADIKNAVEGGGPSEEYFPEEEPPIPNQTPMTQELGQRTFPQNEEYYPQEEYPQQGYPQEEYYPQEGYEDYSQGNIDSNTIIEIAEQVFSEKNKKVSKQMEDLSEFKTITQTKIENIDERLKKIETMIDKLQITILEKIGSYGNNIQGIKKEMNMMQDSFGKIVNKIADNQTQTSKQKIEMPEKGIQ